jgi:Zn-dependent protease
MHYIIIALILIGAVFGFGYLANTPDNTDAIAEISEANSRATENKIEALENRLAGQIALSESRIQSELEKNRLISKHNTEKVIFTVILIAVGLCAFVVMVMSAFWIFSIIQANRREAEYYRLAGMNLQFGGNIDNQKIYVRELPAAGMPVPTRQERG